MCRQAAAGKPEHYQFSFQQLASNTRALLEKIGVEHPIVMGHSTGGMLAFRYVLMYPQDTKVLVAVNPIGLEDWKAKGVPLKTIDQLYQQELKTTADSIREYERKTYYVGEWKPDYDKWVNMLASMYLGKDGELFAWDQAHTTDMIMSQPVVYEFGNISVASLLLIGAKDNTAIGKAWAPRRWRRVSAITGSLALKRRRPSRDHSSSCSQPSGTRRILRSAGFS